MNIDSLLNTIRPCSCGKSHSCGIETVVIEQGALDRLPTLTARYRHILVVADSNTFPLCGSRLLSLLGETLEHSLVLPSEGFLIPNEDAIDQMNQCVTADTDLLVGIGSGVIQDLCKYVSFMRKLPYIIVATAPSMDGYASTGAAMILNHMKVTVPTHLPTAILGDTDILKDAPMDMIRAGYGDILGKYSALNDWKLSQVVNGEYYCPYVYDLTYSMVKRTIPLADGLLARDPHSVQVLMEALVVTGIAMSYAGNSRPASGSEHHLSHFFEITGILNNRPYLLHGIDVAYSTVVTQTLREKILTHTQPFSPTPFDRSQWLEDIRRVYGSAADGVIALQDSLPYYSSMTPEAYLSQRVKIDGVLREVPSSRELTALLTAIGLNMEDFYRHYGKAVIAEAVRFAKDLKDRYTVLWLYNMLFSA